jgi:hypothetical protein
MNFAENPNHDFHDTLESNPYAKGHAEHRIHNLLFINVSKDVIFLPENVKNPHGKMFA